MRFILACLLTLLPIRSSSTNTLPFPSVPLYAPRANCTVPGASSRIVKTTSSGLASTLSR